MPVFAESSFQGLQVGLEELTPNAAPAYHTGTNVIVGVTRMSSSRFRSRSPCHGRLENSEHGIDERARETRRKFIDEETSQLMEIFTSLNANHALEPTKPVEP